MGRQRARNIAANVSEGEFIFFTEDDLAIEKGYLEKLLLALQETKADIVSGRRIWMRIGETEEQALFRANKNTKPVNDMRWLEHNSHAITSGVVDVPLLSGSMLMHRDVYDQVNYDPIYKGNAWREETDFQLNALKKQFRLIYCPSAVSYHYPRSSISFGAHRLTSDLRYLAWIYRNNLLLLRRHKEFLKSNYPDSLVAGSPEITNLIYTVLKIKWLVGSELMRVKLSRSHETIKWQ